MYKIDATKFLEVFVVTNGRESLRWCIKCLQRQQNVIFRWTIVQNLGWLEAVRACQEQAKSPYYLRVDDDMFLHPRALEYYYQIVSEAMKVRSRPVVVQTKLWEDHTGRAIKGLKAYNWKITKKINFRPNSCGKIDRNFAEDAKRQCFPYMTLGCVTGVHCANAIDWQKTYLAGRKEEITDNIINRFTLENEYYLKNPLKYQMKSVRSQVEAYNLAKFTRFHKFLHPELANDHQTSTDSTEGMGGGAVDSQQGVLREGPESEAGLLLQHPPSPKESRELPDSTRTGGGGDEAPNPVS